MQPGTDVPTHSCHLSSPLTLSWNILHFSPPALSKQVIFLLWKGAHCSADIKDRSSLFSLKAAIGEVKLHYADLSEGYNIIQRSDVKPKLLSSRPGRSRSQTSSHFLPSRVPGVLELGGHRGSGGVCGSLPAALRLPGKQRGAGNRSAGSKVTGTQGGQGTGGWWGRLFSPFFSREYGGFRASELRGGWLALQN